MSNEIPEKFLPLPYCLTVQTDAKIALIDRQNRSCEMGHRDGGRELYRFSGWFLEAEREKNADVKTSLLHIFPQPLPDNASPLTIEFERPPVSLSVCFQENRRTERTFHEVSQVILSPGKGIKIMKWNPKTLNEPSESKPGPTKVAPVVKSEPNPLSDSSHASAPPVGAGGTLSGQVAFLQEQIRWQQTMLTNLTAQPLSNLLSELKKNREFLNGQLREKVDEAEHLEREREGVEKSIRDAETRIHQKGVELDGLKDELTRLRDQEEIYNLDCEAARKELDASRQRLEANEDALKLMEDMPELIENSMRKTLDDVSKKMDAMERRLGRIIRFQETYNKSVRKSILEGDGYLSMAEESGGEEDGIGGQGTGPDAATDTGDRKPATEHDPSTAGGATQTGSRL